MQSTTALTLQALQGVNNEARKQAETTLQQQRASDARALYAGLCEVIASGEATLKPIACLMLKKFYLDGRKEEEKLEQIVPADVTVLKQMLKDTLDIKSESLSLLRRKAEIICKLHKMEETYSELVQQLSALASAPPSADEAIVKGK